MSDATTENRDDDAQPQEILRAGEHKLVELLTPEHIQAESDALGCDLGYDVNNILSEATGKKEAIEAIRVFALRAQDDSPVAIMLYEADHKVISQIGGKSFDVHSGSDFLEALPKIHFYSDLCEALYKLKQTDLDLSDGIDGLDVHIDNKVVTRSGEVINYTSGVANQVEILCGKVKIDESMSAEEVAALCSNTDMTLDITDVSNSWLNENLPSHINAILRTDTTKILALEHVTYLRCLFADAASDIILNSLKAAELVCAEQARRIIMPELEEIGECVMSSNAHLNSPLLEQRRKQGGAKAHSKTESNLTPSM